MRVEAVLIVLNGRTHAIPVGAEISDVKIKVQTENGLHDVVIPNTRTTRALAAGRSGRRRQTAAASAANIEKARAASEKMRSRYIAVTEQFLSRLSPAQHALADRLFRRLNFCRTNGVWAYSLGKWLSGLMEACPEPWRLDWVPLRNWLSNPNSIANVARTREGKSPTHARRNTARRIFIDTWSEQIGEVTVATGDSQPRVILTLRDIRSDHPFTAIHRSILSGSLTGSKAVLDTVDEYRRASAITDAEVETAQAMVARGSWLNDAPIPREKP